MKNREIISAIDSALNRIDNAISYGQRPRSKRIQGNAEVLAQFQQERAALVEARSFIAANRKD